VCVCMGVCVRACVCAERLIANCVNRVILLKNIIFLSWSYLTKPTIADWLVNLFLCNLPSRFLENC